MFISYTALVLWTAVLPPPHDPKSIFVRYDKACHFTEYFLLYALSVQAFHFSKLSLFGRIAITAMVFCALMGAATEISQIYVPGRWASFKDWYADLAGAGLGMTILFLNRGRLSRDIF